MRSFLSCVALVLTAGSAAAQIRFVDIAAGGGAGVSFGHVPSSTDAVRQARLAGPILQAEIMLLPMMSKGKPGVVLLDYDNDGDLDVYATNGPGAGNALFSNQLVETGEVRFVDVARAAGVDATDQDSFGGCAGDIDNDGDMDLYVLGRSEPNRLFENLGDGTFADITVHSGTGGGNLGAAACSMGDVDGDGLLDLAVANSFNMATSIAIFLEPYALNERNQLFLNTGDNVFADVSESSGFADVQEITWAIAMIDYDLDGDMDILTASDQAAILSSNHGGIDRGLLHLYQNDGTGSFTDVAEEAEILVNGGWMGLSFADFDCNGTLDFFVSNVGEYLVPHVGMPTFVGEYGSRWFLGRGDGTFEDSGVPSNLGGSVFGWGTSAFDYDNDGDADIAYHGGLDMTMFILADNPGVVLNNQGCSASFEWDAAATAGGTDHRRRDVHGMAAGDLNNDGFVDIVSISAQDIPASVPLEPMPPVGSVFDPVAGVVTLLDAVLTLPAPPGMPASVMTSRGVETAPGTLSVEINSGGNGNGSVVIRTLGTVGITSRGRANRDGVGAVVSFTPHRGPTSMRPVIAGSSYASQDDLVGVFGLGPAPHGRVDVLWPGGTRNRLYHVEAGESVLLPEIPCSYDASWTSCGAGGDYRACVDTALGELVSAGRIDSAQAHRLRVSAARACRER